MLETKCRLQSTKFNISKFFVYNILNAKFASVVKAGSLENELPMYNLFEQDNEPALNIQKYKVR